MKRPKLLRVLCLSPVGNVEMHMDLWRDIWTETGALRIRAAAFKSPGLKESLHWAGVLLLDCTDVQAATEFYFGQSFPAQQTFLVQPGRGRTSFPTPTEQLKVERADDFRQNWKTHLSKFLPPLKVAEPRWKEANADDQLLQETRGQIGEQLAMALRIYFPDYGGSVGTEVVLGGLSGSPLLRVAVAGKYYFVKFFDKMGKFTGEWDKHVLAKQWLGDYTVDLVGIVELASSGAAQAAAFPLPGDVTKKEAHRYPICFRSAAVTATLMELYRDSSKDPGFALKAYREVVGALRRGQDARNRRWEPLMDLRDIAPGTHPINERTILDSLRKGPLHGAIHTAIAQLSRYARVGWADSDSRVALLNGLLDWGNPVWLSSEAWVFFGKAHGDANARNFLFDRTHEEPAGLQIIDCGGFDDNTPLVFDLAQMESDLKINHMASEDSASYGEIDTELLADWWAQEQAAIERPFEFSLRAIRPSTQRAYEIVQMIRARAHELAPDDDYRAYFYCLLYWTLRKLRRQDIPHAKRILALRSACQVCHKLSEWQHP